MPIVVARQTRKVYKKHKKYFSSSLKEPIKIKTAGIECIFCVKSAIKTCKKIPGVDSVSYEKCGSLYEGGSRLLFSGYLGFSLSAESILFALEELKRKKFEIRSIKGPWWINIKKEGRVFVFSIVEPDKFREVVLGDKDDSLLKKLSAPYLKRKNSSFFVLVRGALKFSKNTMKFSLGKNWLVD